MADIKAAASGNWSSTATWSGGVVPVAGDVAYSNGFTVTIDTSISVGSLRSSAGGTVSAVAGGSFTISSPNLTVTLANGIQVSDIGVASIGLLSISASTGTTTVTATAGGINGGSGTSFKALVKSSTGALVINGACTAGTSGNGCYSLDDSGDGNVTINGDVTGSSGVSAGYGVNFSAGGTKTINGNSLGSTGPGIYNNTTATIIITGNAIGGAGSSAQGVNNRSTGNVTIYGDAIGGGNANAFGAYNNSSGSVTIRGSAIANTGPGFGINSNTGTHYVWGDVTASSNIHAIAKATNATLIIGRSGYTSTITDAAYQAVNGGAWQAVSGANYSYSVPLNTTGTVVLNKDGFSVGDGNVLISDLVAALAPIIAAANSA